MENEDAFSWSDMTVAKLTDLVGSNNDDIIL
jgi:hypothetical protein